MPVCFLVHSCKLSLVVEDFLLSVTLAHACSQKRHTILNMCYYLQANIKHLLELKRKFMLF